MLTKGDDDAVVIKWQGKLVWEYDLREMADGLPSGKRCIRSASPKQPLE